MRQTFTILWALVQGTSIVFGFICFFLSIWHAGIKHDEQAVRAVRVGMNRVQVEKALQNWDRGNAHHTASPKGRAGHRSYYIRYKTSWWKAYITYDSADRVLACDVRDPF